MQAKALPIGYWIKQVDTLLTQEINALHATLGITRLKWQILHSIQEKEQINFLALITLLQPFADPETVTKTLAELKNDLLLIENKDDLALTNKGIALHATCQEQQKIFRLKAMAGITEQQYEQTLATLQKIVENITSNN
ncbi:hypothetical protein [Adhaeribacter radiodurans]|uniref:MarR family transcriptional regulator n=1 Tax=Adhaeribacter radiodurans TaxID=2745197 RepID=A0A7L7LD07_9BACT|nr:hypothetical protein [Adhaeribacter radiodurans]QMU30732.1 hypothetical protein HUW48_23085 [Adhaeribacter radiodurans]